MLLGVNETVYIEFPGDHSWKVLTYRSVQWWWCFSYMEYNNTGMYGMEKGWWNDHWVEHLICLLHESRYRACMPAKLLQSCPTLCSWRILEWVAIRFSMGSSQLRDPTHISCVSCTDRQVLYHECHLGSPVVNRLELEVSTGFRSQILSSFLGTLGSPSLICFYL